MNWKRRLAIYCANRKAGLGLAALSLAIAAWVGSAAADATALPTTHCHADERVVFSCPFKNGKTASLCASPNLDKDNGTLQYRFGVVGKKLELAFPNFEEWQFAEKTKHPNWNFHWHSSYTESLSNGELLKSANTRWNPKNLPTSHSVNTSVRFSPIEDNPSIHFLIVSEVGSHSIRKGVRLSVVELVSKGRDLAHFYCIENKTIDELFSLKDIITR